MNAIINENDLEFTPTGEKVNYVSIYTRNCTGCDKPLRVRKEKVKTHRGKCLICSNSKPRLSLEERTKRKRAKDKEKRQKVRDIIEKNKSKALSDDNKKRNKLLSKNRTVKSKGLGTLIVEFDNQMDNSVKAFNEKFDEILGDDENLEVEILNMYTHNGRVLKIGNKIVNHLFFDEHDQLGTDYYIDIFSLQGNFIKRYKSVNTVARDYGVGTGVIYQVLNGHREGVTLQFKIKKVELKKD